MKRNIAVLVLIGVILVSTGTSAQDYKQALRYEIKAGLVSSFLSSNDYQDSAVGWGWTAGVGLFLPFFTKALGLQAEVLYVNKKASATIASGSFPDLPPARLDEYEFDMYYVEVPLLVQLALFDEPGARGYLLGGPAFSINTTGTFSYVDNATGETVEGDIESSSSTDFAPVFGIGFRAQSFLVEFRFNLGLTKVGDGSGDTKLNTSSFLIGFSF